MSYRICLQGGDSLFNDNIRGETPRVGDKLVFTGLREYGKKDDEVYVDAIVTEVKHYFTPAKNGFTSKALVICEVDEQSFEWMRNTGEWEFVEL